MATYLWDLDLEQIPLGWSETYQDALESCPNGELVAVDYSNYYGEKIERYFYHPIKCRELLIQIFNQKVDRARNLVDSEKKLKPFINELFKIDVCLFNLLELWTTPDDEIEGVRLDPRKLEEDLIDVGNYFECDNDESINLYPPEMREYIALRLINLSER
ncbi:hypothetical protein P4V47_24085 [Brevibacillus laterosporus]|uniref:hypothetical protein n=1 Tax=Brevibacillus laterosporus TaxID=1465 RepID=UPI002E211B77|nr:hypothetical protein [Brevibacillus laterosporus]